MLDHEWLAFFSTSWNLRLKIYDKKYNIYKKTTFYGPLTEEILEERSWKPSWLSFCHFVTYIMQI